MQRDVHGLLVPIILVDAEISHVLIMMEPSLPIKIAMIKIPHVLQLELDV